MTDPEVSKLRREVDDLRQRVDRHEEAFTAFSDALVRALDMVKSLSSDLTGLAERHHAVAERVYTDDGRRGVRKRAREGLAEHPEQVADHDEDRQPDRVGDDLDDDPNG